MHVAIVAPSPVPFTIGGAERLCRGLHDTINDATPHHAELVKLPSREDGLWSIIDGYRAFAQLDLSHFDLVISTKYPSWMISHPRHVCYMLHPLRGLYDTYHFCAAPERADYDHPGVRALQRLMRARPGDRAVLPELFDRLAELKRDPGVPAAALAFPGPFVREVVHALDRIGLAPGAVTRYAAISQTVARRRDYFPEGAPVTVAYPPTQLAGLRRGRQDYLFTQSRLDGPKRLDLVVEAMRHVDSPVRLKIAGTGPQRAALEKLAAGDPRIELLGFVADEDAAALYADALAVPFVPYDEDYGFVTAEAMQCGKPVITTHDAGGPTELVVDGVSGAIVAPEPRALAAAIERYARDPALAARHGDAGAQTAAKIDWPHVVGALLGEPAVRPRRIPAAPARARRRLTIAVTFPVWPPRGGGQSRLYHIARGLAAERFDVEIVSLTSPDDPAFDGEIAPHVREIRVPKSPSHASAEAAWSARVDWIPVSDVTAPLLYERTPAFCEALTASVARADVAVACHPYLFPAMRGALRGELWYDAQDIEVALKRNVLPQNDAGRELLRITGEVERECIARSDRVLVCTDADAAELVAQYGQPRAPIHVVANGVDTRTVEYATPVQRAENKRALGLSGTFIAVFMGSWHGPNIEAAESVIAAAREVPEVEFWILGSCCGALAAHDRPRNVKLLGVLEDDDKALVLGSADVALNPMRLGSGSNLKMFEYMAAGLPVITSRFGARGLGIADDIAFWAEPEELAAAVRAVAGTPARANERARAARHYVESQFDWEALLQRFLAQVDEMERTGRTAP